MMLRSHSLRQYLSLVLLFVPAVLFALLLVAFRDHPNLGLSRVFPFVPWQFVVLGISGVIATIGGVLDWRFHRDPLKLQLSKKERDAEAAALGLGGVPMFGMMWAAMMSTKPTFFLVPIVVILVYTTAAICYDEFVFHVHRCGKTETRYHRMLVFGNALAWLAWFHYIYCR